MNTSSLNRSLMLALLFSFTAILSSCGKKAGVNPNRDARFNGTWSHTRFISSFLSILTQQQYNADGTGLESVFRITTSSGDTPENTTFTWSTRDNNTLILIYEDGLKDTLSYTFPDNISFRVTGSNGATREFFKND